MDSEGIGKGSCFTFTMKMDEVDPNSNSFIDTELARQASAQQIVSRRNSEAALSDQSDNRLIQITTNLQQPQRTLSNFSQQHLLGLDQKPLQIIEEQLSQFASSNSGDSSIDAASQASRRGLEETVPSCDLVSESHSQLLISEQPFIHIFSRRSKDGY